MQLAQSKVKFFDYVFASRLINLSSKLISNKSILIQTTFAGFFKQLMSIVVSPLNEDVG